MVTVVAPKAAKWPFMFADVCLIAFGSGVLFLSPQPPGIWIVAASGAAILAGAMFGVWPFILEYKAASKLVETGALQDAMDKIGQLEEVSQHISDATGQWQTIQETSMKTVQTAQAITERIASEARAFTEFLQKTNGAEQSHLRLEIEKFQRSQTDWLHVTVAMLDHTHALHQAAVRSGQPNLVEQLTHFQEACRDVVRRVGLAPFIPGINDFFDGRLHQLLDADRTPPAGSQIGALIAPGYSFQGQLVRRAVVALLQPEQPVAINENAPEMPAPAQNQTQRQEEETAKTEESPQTNPAEDSNPNAPSPPREMDLF